MLRPASLALLLAATLAPGAGAAVRVADDDVEVRALAVSQGAAYVVTDSADDGPPYRLVRTRGSSASELATFGAGDSNFPEVVAAGGRVVVGWDEPVTGAIAVDAARVEGDGLGETLRVAEGTGPARFALSGLNLFAAYPDVAGDVAVAATTLGDSRSRRPPSAMTANGPERRHLPLAVAATSAGTLVLDLVQTAGSSELRVVGPGAPRQPALAVGGLRNLDATMAVSGDRIDVAYLSRGRAVLATSRGGGAWSRRTLPGRGGGAGAPAVVRVGGATAVVYSQRAPGGRELYLFANGSQVRLTNARGDDYRPYAAVDDDGRAFFAWTRKLPGRVLVPFAERLEP